MINENISILIVDDEEMIVDEFLFFLEQFGYNVQGLSDPKIAQEKLKKEKFDIVITDLKMPEVSGMEIAKTIRQYNSDTLIFIITGFATVDSVIEAIQQGIYDYIRKPFKFKEIKIAIERAVVQILLKRENKELNQKIQQMLSYITTLYDISSILYQITDFSMVLEMIIDTITEGLNISKSAIFLKVNNKDKFKISESNGLSDNFIEKCVLGSQSIINDTEISSIHPTIINNIQDSIILDDFEIEMDDRIVNIILAPIKYHNKIMGFLAIFLNSSEELLMEDELKLVNILATQVAPIFQKKYVIKSDGTDEIKKMQPIIENAMDQYISTAEKINSSVSFVQCRIINKLPDSAIDNINDLHSMVNNILIDEIEERIVIFWQNYDSFMLIIPDCNPAICEIVVTNFLHKLEKRIALNEDNSPVFTFDYASCSYPFEKYSSARMIELMSNKLFFNINNLKE